MKNYNFITNFFIIFFSFFYFLQMQLKIFIQNVIFSCKKLFEINTPVANYFYRSIFLNTDSSLKNNNFILAWTDEESFFMYLRKSDYLYIRSKAIWINLLHLICTEKCQIPFRCLLELHKKSLFERKKKTWIKFILMKHPFGDKLIGLNCNIRIIDLS